MWNFMQLCGILNGMSMKLKAFWKPRKQEITDNSGNEPEGAISPLKLETGDTGAKSSKQWVAKAISPGGSKTTPLGGGHKPLAVSPADGALLGSKARRW